MRDMRHIARMPLLLQQKAAHSEGCPGLIGAFPLSHLESARPTAQKIHTLTIWFSGLQMAVGSNQPSQPFRPFWLLFWPQNLTGQLCASPRQLPIFGPHSLSLFAAVRSLPAPRKTLTGQGGSASVQFDIDPNGGCRRRWAKPCHLRQFHGRSVAHRNTMHGTYLDAPRCPGKVRRNLAVPPKGAFRCANLSLPPSSQAPRPLPHAATPLANRRSMAPAQVRPAPRCSTAVWSPVPPLASQATSSTVRKIRAAAKGARGAELIRVPLTVSHDAGTPPPRMISVRGGFACARPTSQHRPQGTAHV